MFWRILGLRGHHLGVRIPDSGLNKPFDRILKAFADEAPELFLRLLGVVPTGARVEITPLRPETAPAVIMPDFVASLTVDAGERLIFHVEFLLAYHAGVPSTMARYGGSLAWQYGCQVMSILMLLRPQGVPKTIPEVGDFEIGQTRTTHPFRVVRLWETDPGPIFATNDWRLLPWSVLMRSSDESVRRVAGILSREGDQESIGRFLTLGSLRYDRNLLEEMLGASKMGLVEAILEGSSLVREATEKAAQEGRQEGIEEGRVGEARRVLRMALKTKFPDLEALPQIESVASVEALESLIKAVISSADRADFEQAVNSVVRLN